MHKTRSERLSFDAINERIDRVHTVLIDEEGQGSLMQIATLNTVRVDFKRQAKNITKRKTILVLVKVSTLKCCFVVVAVLSVESGENALTRR